MKPKVKELIQKIDEAKGNISAIARAYNKPRSTVQFWIESSPTCMQAVSDARHLVVDTAESVLFKKVIESDLTAVFYVLNNSPEARERGWGVKQTDVTSDGKAVQTIAVVNMDVDKLKGGE